MLPKGTARGALVPVAVLMSGVAPQVLVPVPTPAIVKVMVGSTVAETRTASMRAILPVVWSIGVATLGSVLAAKFLTMKEYVSAVASVCAEASPGAIRELVPVVLPIVKLMEVPIPPFPE